MTRHGIPEEAKPSWRRATIVAVLLSALFVAVALVSLQDEGPRIERVDLPEEVARCATDADCTLVDRIGCCGCQSGGARWAINKAQGDTLRRFLKRACRESGSCVQLNTCQDDLMPACVDGRCTARVTVPRASASRRPGAVDG